MTIRFMKKKDKPYVIEIIDKTELFTEQEKTVANRLIDIYLNDPDQTDYIVTVIETENKLAGYICYGPTDLTEGTYDLYWIAVNPDFQRKGLGKQLINCLIKTVKSQNGRLIIIETSSDYKYKKTREFYLKTGFFQAAQIPNFYKDGDDRIIYIKNINKE